MVNQERLIHEFLHLVRFDAESYEERDIADYLTKRLQELGLEVEEDRAGLILQEESGNKGIKPTGNLYAYLPGTISEDDDPNASVHGEKRTAPILLSAHMDTVCPGTGKQPQLHEDGKITSDGTTVLGADDAAGLAEILETLAVIQEQKLPHPEIEVLLPVAEEPYAQGSRVFQYSKLKAKEAYILDMSGPVGRAAVAAPSMISLKIHVEGKAAHAGFCPEDGVNAIAIAARAISRIAQGHIDNVTTVNLGTIQGGTARNIVSDAVDITGEIRSMEHEKALAQVEIIREIFLQEAKAAGGSAYVDKNVEFEAYRIQPEEPVVTRFTEACRALGLSGELTDTFGGSDNNHFVAHGIRGIVVANAMNDVHTTQEWTSISELVTATELVLQLVTGRFGNE
jgi:tripeptide aminopeptidase